MRTDKKPTPFGRAVRMRLAALDMDQKALAQKVGTTPAYISIIIYASKNMFLVNGGIIVVATLVLLCSFLLSKNLYSNREF